MSILKNRKFAVLVLVICIFVSIFGFGGANLASRRNALIRQFNDGYSSSTSSGVRYSMDAYLERAGECARLLAEEYRVYVNDSDEDAARAIELATELESSEEINTRYAALTELKSLVETLFTGFKNAGVSDSDGRTFMSNYRNFKEQLDFIDDDDYHGDALEYNSFLKNFPASLVGSLLGQGALNPY